MTYFSVSTTGLTPDELLTTTRAVRKRLDLTRDVPLPEVLCCLRAAQQAPCGTGWFKPHWVIVRDPVMRREIAHYYAKTVAAKPIQTQNGMLTRQSVDSACYLAEHLAEVPVLVLACLDTGGPLPKGNQASLWATLLPAVWSYMLAARNRGLGTVWTTRHLTYADEIADLLCIPSGVHQAALIPTAYYRGDTFRPARRPPLESSVHLDWW